MSIHVLKLGGESNLPGTPLTVPLVSTSDLTLANEQTIDGVLTSGTLVLLTGQANTTNNGFWITSASGWSRPSWFLSGATVNNPVVTVTQGTVNTGSIWYSSGAVTSGAANVWTQVGPGSRAPDQAMAAALLKKGLITAVPASASLTSNVVTMNTSVPHGMIPGQIVIVDCSDNAYDLDPATVATVPTPTSFTYPLVHANIGLALVSGTLNTWEVVDDGGHVPLLGVRISAITTDYVELTWNSSPLPVGIYSALIGNHENDGVSGSYIPMFGAVGATTARIKIRQRIVASGRASYKGSTGTGDSQLPANWTQEGDTTTAFMTAGTNVMFIGHTNKKLEATGGTGVLAFPVPLLQQCGPGANPVLMNYQASPFTATTYRPLFNGFYCQLRNPTTGAVLSDTDVNALTTAGDVQFLWQRVSDSLLADHRAPQNGVTLWIQIRFKY